MKQTDIDGLEASGLNPVVIDENFDFSQLGAGLKPNPYTEKQMQLKAMSAMDIALFLDEHPLMLARVKAIFAGWNAE